MTLPNCWKNCPLLVATPISQGFTAFWMARLYSGSAGPRPRPSTTMYSTTCRYGVSAFRVLSSPKPPIMSSRPMMIMVL